MRVRLLILLAAVASLFAFVASAGAKTVELHSFATSFNGGDANGAPAFSPDLEKVDVDKATGTVYVGAGSALYKFDSGGVSQPFSALGSTTVLPGIGGGSASGLAVDNSGGATQGRIYAFPEAQPMHGYEPSGAEAAGFPVAAGEDTCGVAVDSSGNIWREGFNQGIFKFNPDGTPTGVKINPEGAYFFCGFEMDSQGNFYLPPQYAAGGPISKYAPNGELLGQIDASPQAKSVAVDRATGDIYVDTQTTINHYDAAGEFVESFGSFTQSNDVAVDANTHAVYVIDNGSPASAQKFTSSGPVEVASATTEAATEIERKGATFHGKLNPEGITTTDCRFEYTKAGEAFSAANSVACTQGNVFAGNSETAVSAVASGVLESQTEYEFRLRVTNANGSAFAGSLKFETFGAVKGTTTGAATGITPTEATLHGSFDPDNLDTHYWFEYGPGEELTESAPLPVPPGADQGSAPGTAGVSVTVSGLEPSEAADGKLYSYRLVAKNETGTTFGKTLTFHSHPAVGAVTTLPATNLRLTGLTLNGSFESEGLSTHYYFQWGATASYGEFAPAPPPGVDEGAPPGVKTVSAPLSGLVAGSTVHYRLVAVNARGTSRGVDQSVRLGEAPIVVGDRATEINTDTAVLAATINPAARATTYHWEYGPEDCSVAVCAQSDPVSLGEGVTPLDVHYNFEGLVPGDTYHFRLVATNSLGTFIGEDSSFITFVPESGAEECTNSLVRKQTRAAATRRCRAYELVSAANTNGYDVESNLVAGLHPLPGFPNAEGKVLYTISYGAVPGSGNPTNRDGDPYLATRGPGGWTTRYVGLQANGTESAKPFSSTLLEADQGLSAFAFGGPEICDPCFSDGSVNIPLRLSDGEVVKGMAGSENPAADPAGVVIKSFSADGRHFVFGSTARFDPKGNQGSLSYYERDLTSGTTQTVSTLPDGETMPGPEIAELDISGDGSRVLIGNKVGSDGGGDPTYDLYMHVDGNPKSVLIADPAGGAHYAGMSADGSQVYFTTSDPVTEDGDTSADLYRAAVTPAGATVTRVSTGEGANGDDDGCDPDPNSEGNHWNEPGSASAATCGVVAIGGGGGVATDSGTAYFLSPELLTAGGVANQPNLYAAEPGKAPVFVATLEPGNPMVRDAVSDPARRETADFQTTPDGIFSAFSSAVRLTADTTAGHVEIYRGELGGSLKCASCLPSNGAPATDTFLTKGGLNLVDDGRVIFTSAEQMVLRDTNELEDAYEWDEGQTGLISTGLDTDGSALLTASADGKDAFFYTRESLAPQDENGGAMKVYDAREGGGFLYNPPPRECVASDECHGPGTQQAPPPSINTIEGTGEPQPPNDDQSAKGCPKGKVERHGKCVKRHHKHPKKHKRHGGKVTHHG